MSFLFYRLTIHDLNVISYYILSITRISHPTEYIVIFFETALLMIMELRLLLQILPSKHKVIIAINLLLKWILFLKAIRMNAHILTEELKH